MQRLLQSAANVAPQNAALAMQLLQEMQATAQMECGPPDSMSAAHCSASEQSGTHCMISALERHLSTLQDAFLLPCQSVACMTPMQPPPPPPPPLMPVTTAARSKACMLDKAVSDVGLVKQQESVVRKKRGNKKGKKKPTPWGVIGRPRIDREHEQGDSDHKKCCFC